MLSYYLTMYLKYLACVGLFCTIKSIKPVNEIKSTKRALKRFINDKNVISPNGDLKGNIEAIQSEKWGYRVAIDISNVISYDEFTKHGDFLKQLFRAKEVQMENKEGRVFLDIINKQQDINFKPMDLEPTKLLIGYDMKGEPIILDMLKTPHVGVQGASNSGKSKGVELALMNIKDKADIILLNVFSDDFKSLVNARRINGNENILKYLKRMIEEPYKRDKPLYLILDELNVIGKDKEINKAIQDVLSQARHFNIYFIALGQSLLKENCPYKQLFNVRITFRAIDKSTIGAFLGCTIENTELKQQEFICYGEELYRGKTYNYSF